MTGCAAPAAYGPHPAVISSPAGAGAWLATQRSDAEALRSKLETTRQQRAAAELQEEIDRLEEEIEALEARLEEVEKRIAEAQGKSYELTSTRSSGSGTVYTGPRGGRYTISPSGKKVYQRRK